MAGTKFMLWLCPLKDFPPNSDANSIMHAYKRAWKTGDILVMFLLNCGNIDTLWPMGIDLHDSWKNLSLFFFFFWTQICFEHLTSNQIGLISQLLFQSVYLVQRASVYYSRRATSAAVFDVNRKRGTGFDWSFVTVCGTKMWTTTFHVLLSFCTSVKCFVFLLFKPTEQQCY